MNTGTRIRTCSAALICLAVAIGSSGCATRPAATPPLPATPKIAVVASSKPATFEYLLPSQQVRNTRVRDGAVNGAKKGAQFANGVGLVAVLAAIPATGGASLLLAWPIDLGTKVVGGGLGAMAGATSAAASGKLPEPKKLDSTPLSIGTLNQSLAASVAEGSRAQADSTVVFDSLPLLDPASAKLSTGQSTQGSNATPSPAALRADGYSGMLEVGITRIGVEEFVPARYTDGLRLYVMLFVVGRGKLTDFATGRTIVREYAYRAPTYYVDGGVSAEWLQQQMVNARAALSEQFAEDLLLDPLGAEGLRSGTCGLAPALQGSTASTRTFEPFDSVDLEAPIVHSVRPSLAWQSFEGWSDAFANARRPASAPKEVVYDLRVWRVRADHTLLLAYERRGLPMPAHTVEQDLDHGEAYQWEVRARFQVDGRERATIWNRANAKGVHNKKAMPTRFAGPQRATCQAYFLPERSRYRFATAQLPVQSLPGLIVPAVAPEPAVPIGSSRRDL